MRVSRPPGCMVSISLLVRSLKENSNNHTLNHIITIIINLNYHLFSACPKYLLKEFTLTKKRSQKDKAAWVQRKYGVDQRHFCKKSLNFKTKEQSIISLHNPLPTLRHTQWRELSHVKIADAIYPRETAMWPLTLGSLRIDDFRTTPPLGHVISLHNTLPTLWHTQLMAYQAIVFTRYFTLFSFLFCFST